MTWLRSASWIVLCALVGAYGCGSESGATDLRSDGGELDANQPPGATVRISGRVLDAERQNGVSEASLRTSSGEEATSDAAGQFELLARETDSELQAERKSYASTLRKLPPGGGSLDVFLKSLDESVQFRGDEGITVRLASGESLEIPKNAVLDEKGTRVKERVTLELAAVDGAQPTEAAALPGDGKAEREDGQKGQASIDRALSITIKNADGKELTVDKEASVIAEVPARRKDADAELTVYSYDRAKQEWHEESKAKRSVNKDGADVYRGDIDHLSWWSFGRFFTSDTCVRVCVEDEQGKPRAGAQVWIVGKSAPGVSSVFMDSQGCSASNTIANMDVVLVAQSAALTSPPKTVRIDGVRASVEKKPSACQDLGVLTLGEATNDSCALCSVDETPTNMDAGLSDAGVDLDAAVDLDAGDAPDANSVDAATPDASNEPIDGSTSGDAGLSQAYYVDPVNGLDSADGSELAPFKTLQKASQVAAAGQTIHLADGVYDATNQPTFQVTWPAGVILRGQSATGVTFKGDGTNYQMTFTKAGGLHDVKFDSFFYAVEVQGSGTFLMSNVQFDNVNVAMFIKGSVDAYLNGGARPMLLNPVANGSELFWIEDEASVDFTGDVSDLNTTGNPLFLLRGAAFLYVHDSAFSNIDRPVYRGLDNSQLRMRNVTMDDIAWPGHGPFASDSGVLTSGGQNTTSPLNHGIDLSFCSITNSQLTGIIVTLYGNLATEGAYRLSDSHIDDNAGYGMRVIGTSPADPGLNMALNLSNTTLKNNGGAGLSLTQTSLIAIGSEVSGNTGDGIQMLDAGAKNSLNLRSCTLSNNVGDGVFFDGSAASTFNLGVSNNFGSNLFSVIPVNQSAVSLVAPITGYAVGNVWLADIQGASSAGTFTAPASFNEVGGRNFTVDVDSTLIVYE